MNLKLLKIFQQLNHPTKHTDWIKDMCNCSDIINDPEYRDDYNRKEYQEKEGDKK